VEAELVIRGGTIVNATGRIRGGVAVAEGRIVAVGPDDSLPEAGEVLDATGLMVLPGVIDTHTHARDPSRNEREDFGSATAAAAAGGITTILEMPISTPSVHSPATLEARVAAVTPRAHVDFGMYGGAAGDNLDEIAGLAAAGVIGYKTFRTPVPAGREREFIGLCAPDAGDYLRALERVAETGLVGAVHAEDPQILARRAVDLQAAGDREPLSHARWRPEVVERASVAQSLELARAAGARIEIAHCSTPGTVELVTRARNDGVAATVETCPHYLFLTQEAIAEFGPFAKINPPLRPAEEVAGLWERVRAGEVDVIGSDHSPFLLEEKEPFWDDMWSALPGAPGLESLLPLMLTAAAEGRLTLEQVVALTSANAARIFGLAPSKGSIAPGADADLVLVDATRREAIDTSRWLTRSRGTARIWDGRPVVGAVVQTILRGRSIFRDGQLTGEPGLGRLVRPGVA
jgi:allantoinase